MALKASLIVLLLASPAFAEPTPGRWSKHSRLAGWFSDGAVAAAMALDAREAWRAPDRGEAFRCMGIRVASSVGVAETVKRSVHRWRPDHSDQESFYSMHTALAASSSGWRYQVGVPLAVGAGYFRIAAGKHYWSDVAAGLAAGYLASRIC